MDNHPTAKERVSSIQQSITLNTCFSAESVSTKSKESFVKNPIQESDNLKYSQNDTNLNKCVTSSQQCVIATESLDTTGISDSHVGKLTLIPLIQYITSANSLSVDDIRSNSHSTKQLNSGDISNSNDDTSLSNFHENPFLDCSELSEDSEGENFVMKLHHFDEILEFISKVYLPCKCDICGTTYNSYEELLEKCCYKSYYCKLCKISFQRKNSLQKHVKKQHSNTEHNDVRIKFNYPKRKKKRVIKEKKKETVDHFTCNECGRDFKIRKYFEQHRCTKNACHLCDKKYLHNASLENHLRYNHSGKRYICDVCGKSLLTPINLRLHMQAHASERNFKCDICDRAFLRKRDVKAHRKLHSGEKPFLCHLCPKTYPSKKNLTAHIKTHSDEKPYKCIVCGSGFRFRQKLKVHGYIHSEKKPHNCRTCGKGFSQRGLLVRHFKIHPQEDWPDLNELSSSNT